jgi:hypothetical protein
MDGLNRRAEPAAGLFGAPLVDLIGGRRTAQRDHCALHLEARGHHRNHRDSEQEIPAHRGFLS